MIQIFVHHQYSQFMVMMVHKKWLLKTILQSVQILWNNHMGSSKTDSPLLQMKTTLWEAWAVFLILCLELYLHLNPVFKRQIIVRNQIMISIIKIFLMKPMNKMNTKLYKNRRKDLSIRLTIEVQNRRNLMVMNSTSVLDKKLKNLSSPSNQKKSKRWQK